MSPNFAVAYARSMEEHPYGFALYQPESSSILRPGACGYLNKFRRWQPIIKVDDEAAVTAALGKHEPLSGALALMPPREMTWGPKTSMRMIYNKIKASGSVPDFGAILHCPTKVQHQGYYHRALFIEWAQRNAAKILEKFPDAKDDGFWIVTDTYSTKRATVNAWMDKQRKVGIEFTVDIVQAGEIGPSGEFARRTSGEGWAQFDAQEGENLVVFFSGIHLKYRWLKLGKVSVREVKGEQPVVIADPKNENNMYQVEYEVIGGNMYRP